MPWNKPLTKLNFSNWMKHKTVRKHVLKIIGVSGKKTKLMLQFNKQIHGQGQQ